MENTNESVSMINMFTYPVFCVRNGIITEANHYAQQRMIRVGTIINDLMEDCLLEYADFSGCCISLTLHVEGAAIPTVVTRLNDTDVFHMFNENENTEIRAMALVAQAINEPLNELVNLKKSEKHNPDFQKSLHKLQRITSNISAANMYIHGRPYGMQLGNITSKLDEILREAKKLAKASKRKLVFTNQTNALYCPFDWDILEKAIFNLISNAIKGSPEQSTIKVTVTASDGRLRLSIQNTDNGLGNNNDLFTRYMRAPQIEDGRHGVGLGIPIAQLAASTHNGTLLLDRPDGETIRFTLSISTKMQDGDILRSPSLQIDHLGGFKSSLVELADVLPSIAYNDL